MLKSPSMRLHGAEVGETVIEQNQNPGKKKAFLKSLLSRKKTKKDEMAYSYMDEFWTSN